MLINLNQYRGQWECSIIAKIFTVTQVVYTITKHCKFMVVSYFLRVIFMCVAYLFSVTVCFMSSSSILQRAKFRISYTYLNTILYFSITYVNQFGCVIFSWNVVMMLKKIRDLNLTETKFSAICNGIWAVVLGIIILNSIF